MVQALAGRQARRHLQRAVRADPGQFVREGNTRGLFQGRGVVSLLTGEPEYLDPLGRRRPEGLVTGYPGTVTRRPRTRPSSTPTSKGFKFRTIHALGSIVGYNAICRLPKG